MPLKATRPDSAIAERWLEKCNPGIVIDYHFCKYGDVECIMPSYFKDMADYILNFKIRPDDIWVITFPKCGTTWTQEMVWLISNELNYEGAKKSLDLRFPQFEKCGKCKLPNNGKLDLSIENTSMAFVEKMKSPRFIKSHLHLELLPKEIQSVKPKILYVTRNVRDVVVSYYHHFRFFEGHTGTLEDFVDAFVTNNVTGAPYWRHVKDFWEIRHEANILFLTYEEMKQDLEGVIRKVSKFLNVSLSEEGVQKLVLHLSFEKMKENEAVNKSERYAVAFQAHGLKVDHGFMRKGENGSWREELSPAAVQKLNKFINENKIEGLHHEFYC